MVSLLIVAFMVNYATRNFFSADPNPAVMLAVIFAANLSMLALVYFINLMIARFGSLALFSPQISLGSEAWISVGLNLIFAPLVYLLTIFDDHLLKAGT